HVPHKSLSLESRPVQWMTAHGRTLARLWRSGERAVDIWDNAEEALPHMPTARATTAPVSIYDLVHTGSNQPTDSADEANKRTHFRLWPVATKIHVPPYVGNLGKPARKYRIVR